ncbi:MAG: hypothetical protein R3A78_08615 [Polyangiales bacterium]
MHAGVERIGRRRLHLGNAPEHARSNAREHGDAVRSLKVAVREHRPRSHRRHAHAKRLELLGEERLGVLLRRDDDGILHGATVPKKRVCSMGTFGAMLLGSPATFPLRS